MGLALVVPAELEAVEQGGLPAAIGSQGDRNYRDGAVRGDAERPPADAATGDLKLGEPLRAGIGREAKYQCCSSALNDALEVHHPVAVNPVAGPAVGLTRPPP